MKLRGLVSAGLDEVVGLGSRALFLLASESEASFGRLDRYRRAALPRLFPAPGEPNVTVRKRWTVGGLVGEELRFRSSYRPLDDEFRRLWEHEYGECVIASARRVRHLDGRRRPTLLYLHGWLQPETAMEEALILTQLALRLDLDVVQLQPPYHGRRQPRGSRFSGELYLSADLLRTLEAIRQNVIEARELTSWLIAAGHGPVGVTGLSMGGVLTLGLAALDDRFAFAAPMVAHLDIGAVIHDGPALAPVRAALARHGWSPRQVSELMGSFGWNDLAPLVPPERQLWVAARYDRFFRPRKVAALWERWGKPEIYWYEGGHMEIATHLWPATTRLRAFLDRLDLAGRPAPRRPRAPDASRKGRAKRAFEN